MNEYVSAQAPRCFLALPIAAKIQNRRIETIMRVLWNFRGNLPVVVTRETKRGNRGKTREFTACRSQGVKTREFTGTILLLLLIKKYTNIKIKISFYCIVKSKILVVQKHALRRRC